ncbi:uncharacterized protein VTP21DRAFT_9485 [Calcarisporiella thermophila]|uniref:uncharacterized protein n=1 Tax=Calcarisporiella thermophila TaxID=911321 RepID=UPI0037437A37
MGLGCVSRTFAFGSDGTTKMRENADCHVLTSWRLKRPSLRVRYPYFDVQDSSANAILVQKLGQDELNHRIERLQTAASQCPTDRLSLIYLAISSGLILATGILVTSTKLRILVYLLIFVSFIVLGMLWMERWSITRRMNNFKERLEALLKLFEHQDFQLGLTWRLVENKRDWSYRLEVTEQRDEPLPPYCSVVELNEPPPAYFQ